MQAKLFAIVSSAAVFIFVIELIRQRKMTFKYSVSWLLVSAVALVLSLEPRLIFRLASWAGFTLPSNFIFFLFFLFVTVLSLLLTIYVNEQHTRSETLAQSLALLEDKIQSLEEGSGGRKEK